MATGGAPRLARWSGTGSNMTSSPSSFHFQVRYKLAPLVWRRMYRADRARYTGAAAPAVRRTAPAHAAAAARHLAALLALAAAARALR